MEYISQLDLKSIVLPGAHASVFKDDCMFSFDTAFDSNGLDICLTCHQAFSRGEINYTQMHSEFFEHKVYLNYKKVLKPNALKIREEQPLKMIKLEIKDEVESDLYDTKCQLYCQQIDKMVSLGDPKVPLKISQVVDAILKATSNERKQEIKSWTQDIKPCRHALNLVQEPLPELNLQQCSSCDLKENLWICLHCGNIGCGREQFGGVPGGSHAVKHHDSISSHHIAVKLGSLTADNADVYCYSCDDEIKVPNLGQLLKTFGIDILSFIKTEKNLTELQIEQNIKWDFNMAGDDGILQPVFGKGLTGLKNLGNSCYMASVLQLMFSLDTFQDAFVNDHGMPLDKILGNYQPWKDLETQMYKLGDGLFSGRYAIPDETTTETIKYQKGLRPSGFKSLIGEGHEEFSTMLQQDAFEFWGYLVDQLEKAKVNGRLETSPLEVLKFVLETKLKCTSCNGVRLSKELDESVSLPISENLITSNPERAYEPTSISDSFKIWKSVESLEYECPKCESRQIANKFIGFKTFPKYLVINPRRVVLENWVPVKVNVPLILEEELNLQNMISIGKTIDEEDLPIKEDNSKYEFNETAMQSLIDMGFPENRVKRALFNTGNSNPESAMNWLFEHMEDADIDDPFVVPSNTEIKNEPDVSSVEMMLSMGLELKLSKKALILSNGNVEQAIEWVFAHPDDDGELPSDNSDGTATDLVDILESSNDGNGKYKVVGIICHKGTSTHSGHYVVFIKKNVNGEERWVLFNDEKVVLADDKSLKEIEKSSYLYVYQKL